MTEDNREQDVIQSSEKNTLTALEEKFKQHKEKDLMRLLYNYIADHEKMGITAAKALLNIISHDAKDPQLKTTVNSFIEILFEDKMNDRDFKQSEYYIDKVIKGRAEEGSEMSR